MRRAPALDEAAVCIVRSSRGTGRGFALGGPRLVVTARHVVDGRDAGSFLRLEFGPVAVAGRVVLIHPHVDVALLEVVPGEGAWAWYRPGDFGSGAPAFVVTERRRGGRDVQGGVVAMAREPVSACQRTTRNRDGREEPLFIFPEPEGTAAHSGAPLLAEDGSAIGVVTDAIDLAGRRFLRAACVDALAADLRLAGRPPSAAGSLRGR